MKIYGLYIEDINTQITCKENESLLQAMSRQGLRSIIYGCYGGGCGQCLIEVLDGRYCVHQRMSRFHILEEDEKKGKVLACCIRPLSDIKIRVISKNKKS